MTTLQIGKRQAERLLDEQMNAGRQVLQTATDVSDRPAFDNWRRDQKRWLDITQDALRHIYGGDSEAQGFEEAATHRSYIGGGEWPDWLEDYSNDVRNGISKLEALKSALRFAAEPPSFIERFSGAVSVQPDTAAQPPATRETERRVIFLVHGRDVAVRETVARFLENAGMEKVVILHEQANRGQTLIEKFEKHAATAKYAVVLLTGDDEGGAKGEPRQPRARQNVVFELGFFFGKLGRDHVAVLYEPTVERPSDVDGLAYISLATNWQQELVRDLRDAGLDFSMDRVV